jgi:hypothetical protein
MPRALRPEIAGGFYYLTCEGTETRRLFPRDDDYRYFVELLESAGPTFGVEIHGFVLLDDAYRLLIKTQSANLKQFMQRINVWYSAWFKKHSADGGAVFGERFQSILVEPGTPLARLSRHFHLIPIREHLVDAAGLSSARFQFFDETSVKARIQQLREYQWSSYRYYAGYATAPKWLHTDLILKSVMGLTGKAEGDAQKTYRTYVEQAARIGLEEDILKSVRKRVFLGSERFVEKMRGALEKHAADKESAHQTRVEWETIVEAVEKVRGRKWSEFVETYGDPGRDLALYAARKHGSYTLKELGDRVGGMGVTAVGQAVTRFESQLATSETLKRDLANIQKEILKEA